MQWGTTLKENFSITSQGFYALFCSKSSSLPGEDFDYFPIRGFCRVEGGFLFVRFYWNAEYVKIITACLEMPAW